MRLSNQALKIYKARPPSSLGQNRRVSIQSNSRNAIQTAPEAALPNPSLVYEEQRTMNAFAGSGAITIFLFMKLGDD